MIVGSVLVCIYAFRKDSQVSDSVKQMTHLDCPFVLFLRFTYSVLKRSTVTDNPQCNRYCSLARLVKLIDYILFLDVDIVATKFGTTFN